ncbi:MAG: hypothetical protein EOP51_24125 [Sphingobacteriales bacterium]|nr:MAG: hypothetical protein EOP51_24125 [Sphingobacteriales bacterium]
MLALFADEQLISLPDGDTLCLTTHRVNYAHRFRSSSHYVSIFLEDISAVATSSRSTIIWLYLAVIVAAVGVLPLVGAFTAFSSYQSTNACILCFVTALILLIFWWLSRDRTLEISSKGGKSIVLSVGKWSHDDAVEFLEAVQNAKAQRAYTLHHGLHSYELN